MSPDLMREPCRALDEVLRRSAEVILDVDVNDAVWQLVQLPPMMGGLCFRTATLVSDVVM